MTNVILLVALYSLAVALRRRRDHGIQILIDDEDLSYPDPERSAE